MVVEFHFILHLYTWTKEYYTEQNLIHSKIGWKIEYGVFQEAFVSIAVYNINGQEVASLKKQKQSQKKAIYNDMGASI